MCHCPPTAPLASNTVTSKPASSACFAATMPDGPAPMIATRARSRSLTTRHYSRRRLRCQRPCPRVPDRLGRGDLGDQRARRPPARRNASTLRCRGRCGSGDCRLTLGARPLRSSDDRLPSARSRAQARMSIHADKTAAWDDQRASRGAVGSRLLWWQAISAVKLITRALFPRARSGAPSPSARGCSCRGAAGTPCALIRRPGALDSRCALIRQVLRHCQRSEPSTAVPFHREAGACTCGPAGRPRRASCARHGDARNRARPTGAGRVAQREAVASTRSTRAAGLLVITCPGTSRVLRRPPRR